MAERLNNLVYAQSGSHYSNSNFNPRSVSLDIRTPEELAAVNDFLLTLGRDVSGISARPPVVPAQSNFSSPESYFDPSNLSQLGLTGMPGIPPSPPSFSDHTYGNSGPQPQYSTNNYQSARSSHSSVPQQQHQPQYSSNIYAPINDTSMIYDYGQQTRRASNKYQPTSSFTHQQQHYNHPTPPLESGGSPPSSVSTPVNVTPPQVPMQMPEFDYIRPTRGAAPVAHLAQPDYMAKPHLRPMIPLKSAPPRERPLPVEPRSPLHEHRPRPLASISAAANASSSSSGSSGSATRPGGTLYPLLVEEGDREFKLPPLGRLYRSSPSPSPSRESTPSSTASSPTPPHVHVLPSIKYVAGGVGGSVPPRSPTESEELARRVGRIGLEREVVTLEQRKRHAELILGLLVDINNNFKRKYVSSGSRDVEMTAV